MTRGRNGRCGASSSSKLSFEQLGIGTQPFLDVVEAQLSSEGLPESQPSAAERANQRLQASLRASLDADRQRGRSPEGPIVAAARQLVSANDLLIDTSAVLNVQVDRGGRVTTVDVRNLENFGFELLFDFRRDTDDSTLVWNPEAVGVRGSLGKCRAARQGSRSGC